MKIIPHFALLATGLLLAFAHHVPADSAPTGNEPTVTVEESKLLAHAEELGARDAAAALRELSQALNAKSSAALPFAMGALQSRLGQWADAEQAFRQALKLLPGFRRARLQLSRTLQEQGNFKEAAAELSRLLQGDDPDKAGVWTTLGNLWLQAQRPAAAETAYAQALVLAPDQQQARLGRIQALLDQKRYATARPLIRREAAEDPLNTRFWQLLVHTHLALGDKTAALRDLECARRIGALPPDHLALLGDLLLEEDLPVDAFNAYQLLLDSPKTSPALLLRTTDAALRTNNAEAAKPFLERLRMLEKALTEAQKTRLLRLRARSMLLADELDRAAELYEAVSRRDSRDGDVLLTLGDIRRRQKRLPEAFQHYECAALLPHVAFTALIRQAQIRIQQNDFPAGITLLEKALKKKRSPHIEHYLQQVREYAEACVTSKSAL